MLVHFSGTGTSWVRPVHSAWTPIMQGSNGC